MGSSPRIRGESISGNADSPAGGIIPANTGRISGMRQLCGCVRWIIPANTGRIQRTERIRQSSGDHPREYGENLFRWWCLPCGLGSSPRIRGEFHTPPVMGNAPGIIPANTGRIWCWRGAVAASGDHPREYGENTAKMMGMWTQMGSSPRIRGEFLIFFLCFVRGGIIPANTGRIRRVIKSPQQIGDHPREYGENALVLGEGAFFLGSSPRIRGEC